MKTLALGLTVLMLGICTACGGGSMASTTPPPPPPPPTVNASITVDSTKSGPFNVAMSTAFQPAEWDDNFFCGNINTCTPQTWLTARTTLLTNLAPHHVRLQTVSQGIPESALNTWNFSVLDSIAQPVLSAGDHSPEMQLGWAPSFLWSQGNMQGTLDVAGFATYTQNMVAYYNTASGFTANGQTFQSPSQLPITWWGILNEPSINNISDTEYVQIYNTVVPAMQTIAPNLKFVAIELCCGSEGTYVPTFAANLQSGVPVDAVATHYYSSCNQKDTDQQLMNTVPGFATSVQNIYAYMSVNAALANVPVWITENNVNADFDKGGGISNCNGTTFVLDDRGSSAFFAAWRPYVFSQVGKAGAQALYHWDFGADKQYGEVDYSTADTQLSYWVDYWLGQMFPAASGQLLLESSNTDTTDIEVLPVQNADGSVVVMVSNHAVASPTDNNGAGLTADVSIDTSALGSFTSASQVVIDSSTSATTGPSPASVSPASPIKLSLNGYSVAFVKLQ